ncbi:MAG: hypothetical protein E7540_06260 [Ruminococcaceae bacterium]|nr:hypothetical protein [Oscillospiraceae bacterium]
MWEIDLQGQIYTLILSLVTGAVFCLVFDIYSFFRLRFKLKPSLVFLFDILSCAFLGFYDFCFFLSRSNGEIRGYVLLGQLLGFFICRVTVSKIFNLILLVIFKGIATVFKTLKKSVIAPILSLFRKIPLLFAKIKAKYSFFSQKKVEKTK